MSPYNNGLPSFVITPPQPPILQQLPSQYHTPEQMAQSLNDTITDDDKNNNKKS